MSDDNDGLFTPSRCAQCPTYITGGRLCPDCYQERLEKAERERDEARRIAETTASLCDWGEPLPWEGADDE